MMNEELAKQIKQAESVEELMQIGKENNYEFLREDAESLFERMHTEGELSDDELDSVSGGGCPCYTKVNGESYIIVTPTLSCFNGGFESGFYTWEERIGSDSNCLCWHFYNKDNEGLRKFWAQDPRGKKRERCGNCKNLGFKGGTGYCKLT